MMRRKLLALLLGLLLFSAVPIVSAQDWISGQVNTVPSTITYSGSVYWQFGFSVEDTNGSLAGNLTCLAPYALVIGSFSTISLGASQNMTGTLVEAGGVLPAGDFLVSAFTSTSNGTLGLEDALRWVWGLLGSLGNVVVSYLQYFAENSLGLTVPTAVMNTLVLVGMAVVWWYARRLPWFVSVVLFVVSVGLASNLVTTMQLV